MNFVSQFIQPAYMSFDWIIEAINIQLLWKGVLIAIILLPFTFCVLSLLCILVITVSFVFFIYIFIYILLALLIPLFSPKYYFLYSLQSWTAGYKFFQPLCIMETLSFSFSYVRQFCWVQQSRLAPGSSDYQSLKLRNW